ncbi:hypothetical protein PFICI_13779 [Pestalotiopsis fici W106-1]|uniref:Uncharacterized protein n=1 Tax=Pestalotiopsis fici (strain W106-1 / CGMCC3.15140) TaxID=1229662 RepID=W3WJ58_PESFW|nr:uncharacterized protein PFICI_13779 [Pestalotiopsis fici W106-1]ETS73913.1 hypothetical protein PFICI_13779 [Pestalotiopsis fici W106-1]
MLPSTTPRAVIALLAPCQHTLGQQNRRVYSIAHQAKRLLLVPQQHSCLSHNHYNVVFHHNIGGDDFSLNKHHYHDQYTFNNHLDHHLFKHHHHEHYAFIDYPDHYISKHHLHYTNGHRRMSNNMQHGLCSTSPSVYMLVDVIYGTNSLGVVGPSATSKIFPLDLDEVSTIVGGTATEQLSLSDLGTDCPQTAAPSVIATLSDSRCDPILAAPDEVKSWAWPCNACGRFGLFDPPYAIPTLTGGLIETTATTTATAATSAATGATPTAVTTTQVVVTPVTTTTSAVEAADTTSEVISLGPSGIVIIAYYSGTALTTTIPTAASTVVYDGQTLTLGGDAKTLTTIDASITASTASTVTTSESGASSSTDNDPTTTSTPSAVATADAPRALQPVLVYTCSFISMLISMEILL